MMEHSGAKLQVLAKVLFWIQIAAGVILGIFLFSVNFFIGLLEIILSAVLAYVSFLFLNAYGELVENTAVTAEKCTQICNRMNGGKSPGGSFYGNPNQQGFYGNPNQQGFYGNPNQQGFYGNPGQQGYYGDPNQQGFYGNPGQQGYYGDPNQQGYNGNANQGPAAAPQEPAAPETPWDGNSRRESDPVRPAPSGNGTVTCPVCGQVQRDNRTRCLNCGVPFTGNQPG